MPSNPHQTDPAPGESDTGHGSVRETESWQAATAPHVIERGTSTRRVMYDVLFGLSPAILAAAWYFGSHGLLLMVVAVVTAAAAESLIGWLRGRSNSLRDGSAAITALLLALSVPPQLPIYAIVIGTSIAIVLGKMAFGGLGQNIFNPAMVGRAFLMICFPAIMTTWSTPLDVHVTTQATPLAAAKFSDEYVQWRHLAIGDVSGSLGETSAVAVIIGGLWLLFRRAADWRLTAGMLLGVAVPAMFESWWVGPDHSLGSLRHLLAGGVMLGAFFIVTDPVTSPLSRPGRWAFGLFVGVMTMIIRKFSGYPEGVMFAILLGNAVTPLLDRLFAPVPVGGATHRRGDDDA